MGHDPTILSSALCNQLRAIRILPATLDAFSPKEKSSKHATRPCKRERRHSGGAYHLVADRHDEG
jgi:hypothetical protein